MKKTVEIASINLVLVGAFFLSYFLNQSIIFKTQNLNTIKEIFVVSLFSFIILKFIYNIDEYLDKALCYADSCKE